MSHDVAKVDLFKVLGYEGPIPEIERVLTEAGLSNPRKSRIRKDKKAAVEELLQSKFLLVCQRGDCNAKARRRLSANPPLILATPTSAEFCQICGGSVVSSALKEMILACHKAGWKRLCIIGGSPTARSRLDRELSDRIEVHLLDGTASRNRRQAQADMDWADHCVIWVPTQLLHKVSTLYSGANCSHVTRRGIEDLAHHVIEQAQRWKANTRQQRH